MQEIMRKRRIEQGLSQADLAASVGLDKRQIRRYEAGEAQPSLSAARAIAQALGISLDELAGSESRQLDLSGTWWAAWQTWKDGQEMTGRWVGLSYDGPIVTGWGAIARTEEEVLALMEELREKGQVRA